MIINYLNEAGPFGSYKKATAQSNLAMVKKDLTREAKKHIIEKGCDELAELFLDMLNEVNSQTIKISNNYHYKYEDKLFAGAADTSNLVELSNYIANKYLPMSRKKEMQLNLIKNVYCNNLAIEYMVSQGCFILPLVDTKRRWTFFSDSKEIISYKNMTKAVAAAADNVIKSKLSEFPSYGFIVPNNVKIIIIRDTFSPDINASYLSNEERQFFSSMGITRQGVDFNYPGQGSSCLKHILDNYTLIRGYCNLKPIKSDEPIWKGIAEPSPWMFNNITLTDINTDISAISADNFYGIKILKFALNNNMLGRYSSIYILIDNVIKNLQYINQLKQNIFTSGLDDFVTYHFNDNNTFVDSDIKIGKEITPEQAKQEGILIDSLRRRVYEFDYNNEAEVKSAAKKLIDGCLNFLTDAKIKKMVEAKMEKYLPSLMSKVLASRPNCASSSNKVLLCDYNYLQKGSKGKTNIRIVIDPQKIEIKNNKLIFYIELDFKLPVRGVNPKYNPSRTSKQHNGKNYAYISGRKLKIEIPL